MKNAFLRIAVGISAMFLISCARETPEYRISMRPEAFERLSSKEKQLVRQGEIAKGMEKDAVLLAWGSPSERVDGLRGGKSMERWDYSGSRPVVTNNVFGGYTYGGYGSYRYSGLAGGFGPQVSYIPYRKASVWFISGRVDEWQRER